MAQISLTQNERRNLRASAHHLDPVVQIGNDGLTQSVQREIDTALSAHGLIKIRVFDSERNNRENIFQSLCENLNAAPVQHIGKLLVLWRPPVEKAKVSSETRGRGPMEVKVIKHSKVGGQKPEVKMVTVLGNQRITPSGMVKKSKPRKASVKKRNLGQ